MNKIEIVGVPAQDAHKWWPRVGTWCERALAHGGDLMLLDDVKRRVAAREMQLWLIWNYRDLKAVCVSEINQWPQAKAITAVIVGGVDMPMWVGPLSDLLEAYGRAHGCTVLDCHGRRGWKKFLESLGWKEATTTFAKRI